MHKKIQKLLKESNSYHLMNQNLNDCLNDPSLHSEKEDWKNFLSILSKENNYYLNYNLSNAIITYICGRPYNINTIALLIEEHLSLDPKSIKRYSNLFINSFSWTRLNVDNLLNLVDLLIPKLFRSKRDIFLLASKNCTKSARTFQSSIELYKNYFEDKEKEVFLKKLSTLIKKLKVNTKNSSIVARAISNSSTLSWIKKDPELIVGVNRFINQFTAREMVADKNSLIINLLDLNKDDEKIILLIQENYIRNMCISFMRYEKRVLSILDVPKTSPRLAFLQLTGLNKDTKFMFKKFPELQKLAIMI